MCANHEKEQGLRDNHNLVSVGWAILVMGLSLTAVVIICMWFGHIGLTFLDYVLADLQMLL